MNSVDNIARLKDTDSASLDRLQIAPLQRLYSHHWDPTYA